MATIKQYARNLWQAHRAVARKLGTDPAVGSPDERIQILSTDVLLAGLCKALTDAGVLTDAQLNTVFTAVANADYPVQRAVLQPEDGPAPDPDLGG